MFSAFRGLFAATVILIACAAPASAQSYGRYWQCAPFAREISGIQLFGRAAAWWDQAAGRYDRGNAPRVGSVLSFKAMGKMPAGHVAMVSEVVSERVIHVTHANWSPINGRRGQVEENVEVIDVSPANDWTEVRVWYAPLGGLGTSSYATNGFIYAQSERLQLASAQ
jgi:Surface antigen